MTVRTTPSRRTTRLSALAVGALVALTGCGTVHPGAAAVVGSATISHDTVDDLATALCTANMRSAEAGGQPAPQVPTRGTREGALQILLETTISQEFGEQKNVQPPLRQVSQAVAQNQQIIDLLPEAQAEDYRQALAEFAEAQLTVIEIGRESLREQGQPNVSDEQAIAEGERLRQEFAKTIDIEVDPRYGTFEDGTLQVGESSLSVPGSDRARAGAKAEPGPEFVSALPASQRCS